MKYKTAFPINISDDHKELFYDKQFFLLPELKIKPLKNVFISQEGLIIKNFLLPFKSAENIIGSYDKTFYWSHWRKAIEQFLVCKYGKSLKSIYIDDSSIYFTIHTPWFGYFSWITTYIPRLLMVQERFKDAILLMPEEWETIPYVRDSLKMFPNLKKKIIPNDHHLFVKNYIFAQVRPWTSIFYPEHIFSVRTICFDYLDKQVFKIKPIPKLYVSRRKANRRKIINEQVIEEYLKQLGFESICFEDYSVFEQMYLMRHSELFVSMHGAGLTNILFMTKGSKVLELTPIVETPNQFRLPFWRMASLLDIDYYIQFCKIDENDEEKEIYSKNILVDLAQLKNNLSLMVQG